jgi:hypothetical protein
MSGSQSAVPADVSLFVPDVSGVSPHSVKSISMRRQGAQRPQVAPAGDWNPWSFVTSDKPPYYGCFDFHSPENLCRQAVFQQRRKRVPLRMARGMHGSSGLGRIKEYRKALAARVGANASTRQEDQTSRRAGRSRVHFAMAEAGRSRQSRLRRGVQELATRRERSS